MRLVALFACLGLAGCGNSKNGLHEPDMAKHEIMDLSMPDLATLDCGAIVSCAITQLASNPLGAAQCLQGASPMGARQAGELFLCAAQKCLQQGDGGLNLGGLGGGGGNQLQLLQCLSMNCQTQLSGCSGLGII
jgi:hypothetical protein